jgi:hypothetical protein
MDAKLKSILKKEQLEHLLPIFMDQGVTDSILGELSDDDLRELGIDKFGERKVLHGILWLGSKGCEKMRGWKHTIKFSANTTEECLDLPKVGRFPGWTCDWKTSAWNCVWVGRGAGRFARNVVRV